MNEKNNENLKVDFTRSKRFFYRKINCFICITYYIPYPFTQVFIKIGFF